MTWQRRTFCENYWQLKLHLRVFECATMIQRHPEERKMPHIWIHEANVGEAKVLLDLFKAMREEEFIGRGHENIPKATTDHEKIAHEIGISLRTSI